MHHRALHWYISFLRLPFRGGLNGFGATCVHGRSHVQRLQAWGRDRAQRDGGHPPEAPVWFLPCEAAHRLEVSLFFLKNSESWFVRILELENHLSVEIRHPRYYLFYFFIGMSGGDGGFRKSDNIQHRNIACNIEPMVHYHQQALQNIMLADVCFFF